MNWYKVHHGMPLDTKLAVIAKRAGMRRGEVLALWVTLLDHASRNKPRGSLKDIEPEEIALTLEFDPAAVDAAIKAFRDKRMISADELLTDWKKSQVLPPATRAHDYRNRQRQNRETLPPHTPATPEKRNDDDDDSEEASARRRQRLREEIVSRHKKRGRTMAKAPVLPSTF